MVASHMPGILAVLLARTMCEILTIYWRTFGNMPSDTEPPTSGIETSRGNIYVSSTGTSSACWFHVHDDDNSELGLPSGRSKGRNPPGSYCYRRILCICISYVCKSCTAKECAIIENTSIIIRDLLLINVRNITFGSMYIFCSG